MEIVLVFRKDLSYTSDRPVSLVVGLRAGLVFTGFCIGDCTRDNKNTTASLVPAWQEHNCQPVKDVGVKVLNERRTALKRP